MRENEFKKTTEEKWRWGRLISTGLVLFFSSLATAQQENVPAFTEKNVKKVKGPDKFCAGGRFAIRTNDGVRTVQIGPLLHLKYDIKKPSVKKDDADGCVLDAKTFEKANSVIVSTLKFERCRFAEDNRSYQDTFKITGKKISYDRKKISGVVSEFKCEFE